STVDLVTKFPTNAIMKIEQFPKEMFDEKRYGPMEEWIKKNGRDWGRRTLPQKEPYQKWLKEVLEKLPADQNVFEITNEPWNKMSPEDFAEYAQWVLEVVKEVRPDAIVGPNLIGSTSEYKYDAAVYRAGGMKGMNMVALHPYAESEDRAWLRKYKAWLNEQSGHEMIVTVTEYGSHSAPEGPHKRSEEEQAVRIVGQSLALYAEDVAIIMPHTMGQREQTPTYHEDWFGLIRLAHQPKPALLGLATCARMIDASNYAGDLWFGPDVGANLFEKDGAYTLALFTREGAKNITLETDAQKLTLVDMMGKESAVEVKDGKLPLEVTTSVTYVTGLTAAIAKGASKELRADRWPQPEKAKRVTRSMKAFPTPPTLDGKFDEWKDMTQLSMMNPKVAGDDCSGFGYLAYDKDYLYVGVDMRDNQVLNTQPRTGLYRHDSLELFVSAEARDDNPGYGPNDYQFFITPTSAEGKPVVALLTERSSVSMRDLTEAKYSIVKTKIGWAAEVAIPWSVFKGFKPKAGEKLALEMRVNDADNSHERFCIDIEDAGGVKPHEPTSWAILKLE
ncbi:MAG: hypothetical protein JXR97_13580, partial [Planctomycetes bacterium]|nr:hypothetical protein [Planctomycetota bacterium]